MKIKKTVFLILIALLLGAVGGFVAGKIPENEKIFSAVVAKFAKSEPKAKVKKKVRVKKVVEQTIFPTVYICGSSGNASSLDPLIYGMFPQTQAAKQKLEISVNIAQADKVTVVGKISRKDAYPIVEFGTGKGTVLGEDYSRALQVAVRYLMAHYRVPWLNLVGFSSGGTGAIYYMGDTGENLTFPPVKKFVSIDGEYNGCEPLAYGETLGGILTYDPVVRTNMYREILARYQKISQQTQMIFLVGDNEKGLQTDGKVPWADSLSLYHLFRARGNQVSVSIYPTQLTHAQDKAAPIVIRTVKDFIDSKNP